MKKFYFLVACASLMVMGANAQTAEELYKAGKAEFEKYDKLYGEYVLAHQQKEDAPDATATERATALMKGFELLQKALPLDTVIEKNKDGSVKMDKKTGKPKFKTKYSKDIVPLPSTEPTTWVPCPSRSFQSERSVYDVVPSPFGVTSLPCAYVRVTRPRTS